MVPYQGASQLFDVGSFDLWKLPRVYRIEGFCVSLGLAREERHLHKLLGNVPELRSRQPSKIRGQSDGLTR